MLQRLTSAGVQAGMGELLTQLVWIQLPVRLLISGPEGLDLALAEVAWPDRGAALSLTEVSGLLLHFPRTGTSGPADVQPSLILQDLLSVASAFTDKVCSTNVTCPCQAVLLD